MIEVISGYFKTGACDSGFRLIDGLIWDNFYLIIQINYNSI